MKKNYLFKYLLYLCITLSIYNSYSQTARVVVKGMGPGFNLGNVFDNGQKSTNFDDFKPIIDAYAAAGMTHIRIPITWYDYVDGTRLTDTNGNIETTNPRFIELVKTVDYALSKNLYVVLNTHHEHWLKDNYDGSSYYNTIFTTLWSSIATYFQSYPSKLVFEVLNEPEGIMGQWGEAVEPPAQSGILLTRQINKVGYDAIRGTGGNNLTRIVMISPNGQANDSQIEEVYPNVASLPGSGNDQYLAMHVHSYDPWDFCGQTGSNANYPGAAQVINDITVCNTHAQNNLGGIAIEYGEFGVGRQTTQAERADGVVAEYYQTFAKTCHDLDIAFTVWDDRGWFGLINDAGTAFTYNLVPNMLSEVLTPSVGVIGEFSTMDGGFESFATPYTLTSTSSSAQWSTSSTSSVTKEILTDAIVARSGKNYVAFTSNATGTTRIQSPTVSTGITTGATYTVQYFVKTSTASPFSFLSGAFNSTTSANANITATPATYTANTWIKATATFTAPTIGATTYASVRLNGTLPIFGQVINIDDFVVYTGNLDVSAPEAPSVPIVSGLNLSWTAPATGVDSGGYIVVRYATQPNADNDPKQNGIYKVGNTLTDGTGSLLGTVVYVGSATSFTDEVAGSVSGSDYYKVYTVDKAYNYSAEIQGNSVPFTYYYDGSGLLSDVANWGSNTNGSGIHPTTLIATNTTYVIKNTTAVATDATWALGTGSKIILGEVASTGVTLTVGSGKGITGTLDISAASSGSNSLLLQDPTLFPTFGTLHSTSEVHLQSTTNALAMTATFGKLFIDGGASVTVSTLTTNYIRAIIQTSFTIASGSSLTLNNSSNSYFYINTGGIVTVNGTLKTSKPAGIVGFGLAAPTADTNTSPALQFFDTEIVGTNFLLTGSTIDFNRGASTTTQIVAPRSDYNNVTFSDFTSAGNKTLSGNMVVSGTLTLNHANGTTITGTGSITLGNGATIVRTAGSFGAIPLTFGNTVNVTYNGTTAISTAAEIPTDTTVLNNLTINTIGGVTLTSATAVNNKLTLTAGTLTTANLLTLKSNASKTAYVAPVSGNITGNVIAERYIPAKRAYRILSSPVSTSNSIFANWQEGGNLISGYGTHITGSGGASNGFDATSTNSSSLYTHNNANPSWIPVATTNGLITAGNPYLMYVRGSREVNLTNNSAVADNTTLRTRGLLKTGTVAATDLNSTAGGFSLIGNPYQAQVDVKQILTTSTNLNTGYYYILDPKFGTKGVYVTVDLDLNLNNLSGSQANQYAQPWQAFFVKTTANGAASLSFTENDKSDANIQTAVFKTANTPTSRLVLSLYESSALAQNGYAADGLVVVFDANESNDVNNNDAPKMTNLDENFSTINNGKLLSIEKREIPLDLEEIPLQISKYTATTYTIKAQGISLSGSTPYLFDKYTNITTEILQDGTVSYAYTVDKSIAESVAPDRFKIIFGKTLGTIDNDFSSFVLYPNPSQTNSFQLTVPQGMDDLEIAIHNVLGQKQHSEKGFKSGSVIKIIPNKILSPGVYFVTLTSGSKKVIKKWIVE